MKECLINRTIKSLYSSGKKPEAILDILRSRYRIILDLNTLRKRIATQRMKLN